jgi:ubiquinone/menaquinone biosynthesis C-methylase UbiE
VTVPDYEYYGLMATTWDLFRGDTSAWEDREFYLDIIQRYGQPVLDVGCATGRLLVDYAAIGVDCDGVDNSPEMLAIARDKAAASGVTPALFQQAMATLDLPRRYRTILVPSSSFQLLVDPAEAAAAMGCFCRHLEPGGVLAMPFMALWREGDPLEKDWDVAAEAVRPEDGATIRKWSRSWYEPAAQLEHTEDRYDLLGPDGDVVASEHHRQSPATRWYSQEQVQALYRTAGFSSVRLYRGFSWEPAALGDWLFTAVGVRP